MSQFAYTENITQELFGNDSSLMVELFSISNMLDSSDVIRFNGGMNELKKSIIFGGEEYFYIPHEASGFEIRGDGRTPRPNIKILSLFPKFLKKITKSFKFSGLKKALAFPPILNQFVFFKS